MTVSSDSADGGSGVDSARFQRRPAGGGTWTTIDTDTSSPYSTSWDTTPLADGDYDLRVLTTDQAGNTFTSATRTVTVDNTAPSVTVTAPTGFVNAAAPDPFTATATTPDGDVQDVELFSCSNVSVNCSSGSWVSLGVDGSAPYSASWPVDPDGNRALRAVATDGAGNTGSDVVNVTVDRTSPTGSLTAPADGTFVTATVAVSSDSADGGSGVDSARFQRRPAGGGAWTTIDTDTSSPYSTSWDTTPLADGDYDLRVLTTDQAGNTFTSGTRTVTVDNSAPSTPLVTLSESSPFAYASGAEVFVNTDETGSYDVEATSSDAHSGIDKMRFPGPTDDSSSPYRASYGFSDLAGAQSVTAFNGVGLTASTPFTVTPDTAEPSGGSVGYPDGYDADGDVTITVDAGADALSGVAPGSAVLERRTVTLSGGTCDPFGGGWSAVTSPDTVASGLCAEYRYRVSDRVGNEAAYTSANVVKVDLVDPAAPALALVESSPFAHVVGTEIFVNTDETGSYDVQATTSDAASGLDKVVFPAGVEDTSPPFAATYDLGDLLGVETVTAHDRAGNTASSDFEVTEDVTDPSTSDDTASIGSTWQTAPVTVTLTPTDGRSGVAATYYTTDGSVPTTSSDEGTSIDLTSDGVYTIRYFSLDNVGNVEPVRTAFTTIRIDQTSPSAPVITLDESSQYAHVSGSEIFVNTAETGSFGVSATSSDAGSGIHRISFPGGIDDTTSPYSTTYDLDDLSGSQTVTAHDVAGLTASATFTVTPDTAAPTGGFVDYPDGFDADGTVTVAVDAGSDALSGVNPGSGVLERRTSALSGAACAPFVGGWSAVTSPDTVPDSTCARYRYRVFDRVGNEAIYTLPTSTVKVDLTDPQTTIDSAPSDPSNDTAPDVAFSSSEPASTFQCRLDGGAWSACTSPESLAGLADGSHTFQVRATDAAGHTDASPASHTWTVDAVAPNTSFDDMPPDPSNDDAPTFEFSANETGSTFECRLDGGLWTRLLEPGDDRAARRRQPHVPGARDRRRGQRRLVPRLVRVDGGHRRPQHVLLRRSRRPDERHDADLRVLRERGRLELPVPPRRRPLGRVHQPGDRRPIGRRQPHLRGPGHGYRRQPGDRAGVVHMDRRRRSADGDDHAAERLRQRFRRRPLHAAGDEPRRGRRRRRVLPLLRRLDGLRDGLVGLPRYRLDGAVRGLLAARPRRKPRAPSRRDRHHLQLGSRRRRHDDRPHSAGDRDRLRPVRPEREHNRELRAQRQRGRRPPSSAALTRALGAPARARRAIRA